MLLPEGPWVGVHVFVDVSGDNISKTKKSEMKCVCEPFPDLWTSKD